MLLPLTVTAIVPPIILYFAGLDGMAFRRSAPWNGLMLAGTVLAAGIGLTLFVATVSLFVHIGRGTLAPWNPPQRLVVAGPYRHVRNPMISGVLFILLAEVLFFGSLPLLGWLALFFTMNAIYIPRFEEPGLEKRFGDEYVRYKRHVPRWIPCWTAWQG